MKKKKHIVLVVGGARSGKSGTAYRMADRRFKRPVYLATAEALDGEMEERIRLHRKARGARWGCVEEPLEVARVLSRPPKGCDGILLDCLTLWLSNVLCKEGAGAVEKRNRDLIRALKQAPVDVVLVANEVGMGVVPDTPLGRKFRDLAGWLNQDVAEAADEVMVVMAGIPMTIKKKMAKPPMNPEAEMRPGVASRFRASADGRR